MPTIASNKFIKIKDPKKANKTLKIHILNPEVS